jgi:hypothetical protein
LNDLDDHIPTTTVASTPRVIINNSVYRHRQNRDRQEREPVFESHSYPTYSLRSTRPPPRVVQPSLPNTAPIDRSSDTMCVNEIFTEERADGRIKTRSEVDYCPYSRHGQLCNRTKELRHPPGYKKRPELPPTPPTSYHSDHTSDSERSSRRLSSIYINDRKHSSRHDRHGSNDRVVYVSSSPLSRTSPLHQRSVPSSPVRDVYDTYESAYREDERERPTSSHSRPSIKVEIINEQPKTHRRHASSSKTSSSRGSSEEERRQRRTSDLQHGDQHRVRKKESEIARQNKAIADRTPVPHVPSSPSYRRGSVAVVPALSMSEQMLYDEEKQARRRQKKEAEARERDEEAQRRRLKDRFNARGPYIEPRHTYYP